MAPGPAWDNAPPERPDIDRRSIVALVEYAKAYSSWSQEEIDHALRRDLKPHPQEYKNLEGWAFVALALAETYNLDE